MAADDTKDRPTVVETEERPLSEDDQFELQVLMGWSQLKSTPALRHCYYAERMYHALVRGGDYCYAERRRLPEDGGLPELEHLKTLSVRVLFSKRPMQRQGKPVFVAIKMSPEHLLFGYDLVTGLPQEDCPSDLGAGRVRRQGCAPDLTIVVSRDWAFYLNPRQREAEMLDALRSVGRKDSHTPMAQQWEIHGRDIHLNAETLRLYGEDAPGFNSIYAATVPHFERLQQVPLFDFDNIAQADKRAVGQKLLEAYLAETGLQLYRPHDGAIIDGEGAVVGHLEIMDDTEYGDGDADERPEFETEV